MNKITDIRLSFTVIRSVSFNVTFCFYTSCRLQKTMYLPSLYDQTLRIWDGSLDLVPECNLFFIIFLWNSIFIPFNNFKGTVRNWKTTDKFLIWCFKCISKILQSIYNPTLGQIHICHFFKNYATFYHFLFSFFFFPRHNGITDEIKGCKM